MVSTQDILDESRRFMCVLANDADGFFDYVARGTSRFPLVQPLNQGADQLRERIKQAACNGLPPEPKPGDNIPTPPFPGGQCETLYEVVYSYEATFAGNPAGVSGNVRQLLGPIGGITIVANGPTGGLVITIETGNGPTVVENRGGSLWSDEAIATIDSVTRLDGAPDDCGDPERPPPEYDGPIGPPTPNPDPTLPPIPAPPGTIIPRPPEYNGPDFPIVIPFVFIQNDFEFKFDVDIDLEFKRCCSRPPGRQPRLPRQPGEDTPGNPAPPESPPESPDDPDPPETESVLVGVIIKTTILANNLGETTRYGDGDKPDLFFPRVASVVFALQIDGANVWTNPIEVNVLSAFIPYVGDFFPYDYEVKPALGYSCDVTPVYLDNTPLPEPD